jgi:hypothetical protein
MRTAQAALTLSAVCDMADCCLRHVLGNLSIAAAAVMSCTCLFCHNCLYLVVWLLHTPLQGAVQRSSARPSNSIGPVQPLLGAAALHVGSFAEPGCFVTLRDVYVVLPLIIPY